MVFDQQRIIEDNISLGILLHLDKHKRMPVVNLLRLLSVNEVKLKKSADNLETRGYIHQNPASNDSKQFSERRYVIGINGIFLLNKIKHHFPNLL